MNNLNGEKKLPGLLIVDDDTLNRGTLRLTLADENVECRHYPLALPHVTLPGWPYRYGPTLISNALPEQEEKYIWAALELAQNNMSEAAKPLGLHRTTLYSHMKKLQRHHNTNFAAIPAKGTGK